MGRLVVVTGTGTEIGKTHLGVSLVLAARARGLAVTGYKPIESGLPGPGVGDAHDLREASSHPLDPSPLYAFADPVSPHLAAERTGTSIDVARIVAALAERRTEVDLVLVELAGGLFSPLGPREDNATLLKELGPDAVVLVAPDALGVLHDVRAAAFAAEARGLPKMHLAMIAPPEPDASTGHNLPALEAFVVGAVEIGRADRATLGGSDGVTRLLRALLGRGPGA